jgi:hypothetical protein
MYISNDVFWLIIVLFTVYSFNKGYDRYGTLKWWKWNNDYDPSDLVKDEDGDWVEPIWVREKRERKREKWRQKVEKHWARNEANRAWEKEMEERRRQSPPPPLWKVCLGFASAAVLFYVVAVGGVIMGWWGQ